MNKYETKDGRYSAEIAQDKDGFYAKMFAKMGNRNMPIGRTDSFFLESNAIASAEIVIGQALIKK